MQERTDDQLDDLFRKSAEEFDPPFDPSAWQAMRSRLDAQDRPQTPVFGSLLRWGLPGLLILLLTVGGWYAYRMSETRKALTVPTGERKPAADGTPLIANAPAGTERIDATAQSAAGTDKANDVPNGTERSPSESGSLPELAATEPAEPNVNRKSTSPTRARPAFDRSTEPADQRSATARSSGNRRRRVGKGVTSVGSSPVQSPEEPLADKTSGDKTAPSTGTTLRSNPTALRNKKTTSMKGTPSRIRRQRLAGNVLNPAQRRSSDQYAVGSKRATGEQTTDNVKNTGNRTNGVTALIGQKESELEREINRRPDRVKQFDHQPQTNRSPSDRSADAVKPGETVSGRSADAPGNPLTTTTGRLTNQPAVPSLAKLAIRPQRWSQPVFAFNRDMTTQPDEELEPHQPMARPVPTRGLSVRFVVAPDLSTIGLRNFERPGTNVGLLAEYRLASRWSIQAGVIRSTKIYKASATDYELPGYFHVLPESVSGRCGMLDIPINLRYDWALRPRATDQAPSRWFVSGGLTTYVMQQEDYYYNYANPNDPSIYPNKLNWHGSTGRYNFSQLNLSAGYERALSQRLSWQVEPFMKVPLRGIGYLKIDLLSTGAFFSLRYRL